MAVEKVNGFLRLKLSEKIRTVPFDTGSYQN